MYDQAVVIKFIDSFFSPCVDSAVLVGGVVSLAPFGIALYYQCIDSNLIQHIHQRTGAHKTCSGLVAIEFREHDGNAVGVESLVIQQVVSYLLGFHDSLNAVTGTDYHRITLCKPYRTCLPREAVEFTLTINLVKDLH